MKPRFSILFVVLAILSINLIFCNPGSTPKLLFYLNNDDRDQESRYTELRAQYEFDMLKDPATGQIPRSTLIHELDLARTIPERVANGNDAARLTVLNTYYPAGPTNQGGRTRGLAFDVRYNGTTNQVIIAGGVSGGIMRSSDGGGTWTRVSPDGQIHNVSCITQDPRPGFQDTWYSGGGEPIGNSASDIGAVYLGFGLYKSTDNGVTWTQLPLNTITDYNGNLIAAGVLNTFDNPFDFVHKVAINPVTGYLYVAGHRRLMRSSDGGNTFQTVFGSGIPATSDEGQMDVAISSTGNLILAVNGGNPDPTLRGVWTSSTGNLNSWTRIAGGSTLGVDSVANWRANSYSYYPGSTSYVEQRILMAMAPSNQNIVYVLYENGLSNTASVAEADLFKLNMTSGNSWTNLSANVPDFPGGNNVATNPFTVQGGYDMFVTVKPDDTNFVLLGGTSLYRSTDGFSTANYNNTISWIGGYGNSLPQTTYYNNSHPDIHNAVFNPANYKQVICANDGGLQITNDITAAGSTVAWVNINNYQTLQYYHVAMDPGTGRNNFIGGAQDNGTQFRDKMQLLGTAASDSNNHIKILSGDGGHTGMAPLTANSQILYASYQLGNILRFTLSNSPATDNITPQNLTTDGTPGEFGEFVTNFLLDPDNTQDLYYINYNRLFRTTNAPTVDSANWTELTGVAHAVNPSNPTSGTNVGIRALVSTRGTYDTSHVLYIGTTSGKIFRLNNPANAAPSTVPVDITPPSITPNSNVQYISVNPNNDNEIMAVVTNYNAIGIWWTNNAKSAIPTWINAEGNLTSFSIRSCMIVVKKDASNNPSTEYYVGTSVGLYSTVGLGTILQAGGTPVWQREGGSVLNFAVVVSLAYRPVDNVMVIGTHGNGMYYTFLGTPDYNPNSNPVPTNDSTFIIKVYPNPVSNNLQYMTGSIPNITNIYIEVFNMSGQLMFNQKVSYANGSFSMAQFAGGAYILNIYSDNKKYRYIKKIIKQ